MLAPWEGNAGFRGDISGSPGLVSGGREIPALRPIPETFGHVLHRKGGGGLLHAPASGRGGTPPPPLFLGGASEPNHWPRASSREIHFFPRGLVHTKPVPAGIFRNLGAYCTGAEKKQRTTHGLPSPTQRVVGQFFSPAGGIVYGHTAECGTRRGQRGRAPLGRCSAGCASGPRQPRKTAPQVELDQTSRPCWIFVIVPPGRQIRPWGGLETWGCGTHVECPGRAMEKIRMARSGLCRAPSTPGGQTRPHDFARDRGPGPGLLKMTGTFGGAFTGGKCWNHFRDQGNWWKKTGWKLPTAYDPGEKSFFLGNWRSGDLEFS